MSAKTITIQYKDRTRAPAQYSGVDIEVRLSDDWIRIVDANGRLLHAIDAFAVESVDVARN
jgi:hypothetical protein